MDYKILYQNTLSQLTTTMELYAQNQELLSKTIELLKEKKTKKKRKKKWLFVALENQFTKRLTRKRSGMSCPVCLCV